jgi:hypothetical protein
MKVSRFLFAFAFLLLVSCNSNSIDNESEYLKWINDEENGLIIHKYSNDFKLSMKYVPPEYSAYKEIKSKTQASQKEIDSLTDYYSKSLTFIFTIGPSNESSSNNVMYYNVFDEVSFKERVQELNFNFSSYFILKYKGSKLVPVLYLMDNTYETKNSRSFYFVFVPESKDQMFDKENDFEVIFNDEIFDTGITHFKFKSKKIYNAPAIDFWKK